MKALIPVIVAGLTPFMVLALIVSGLAFGMVAWQPPIYWANQFGTSGANISNSVTAAASDANGLYLGGFVGSPQTRYGATPSPSFSFVSKYDLSGHQIWMRAVGNPLYTQISELMLGQNGLFVSETINNTLFLQNYSENGTRAWTAQVGNLVEAQNSIAIGENGVYVALLGTTQQNGTYPILVNEYDFNGTLIWAKSLGNETAGNVVTYANNYGFYIAGSDSYGRFDTRAFLSAYSSNGTLEWTESLDQSPNFSCYCTPVGLVGDTTGIYLMGLTLDSFPGQEASGHGDLFIRKYDWSGNTAWTSEFSSPDYAQLGSPAMSEKSQGLYLTTSSGAGHGFIVKYDNSGTFSWFLQVDQSPMSISAGDNGAYVGGFSSTTNLAILEQVGSSSSLVLFGLNPPISFGVVALLSSLVAMSVIYFSRRRKYRPRSVATLQSAKIPADATLAKKYHLSVAVYSRG